MNGTDWWITTESFTSEHTTSTGRQMPHTQLALLAPAVQCRAVATFIVAKELSPTSDWRRALLRYQL